MRRYELMLLFQPDLEDDQLQAAVERVTRAIVNAGGSLSKISPWGKRRLAYPIRHHRDASYFLIHFDIEPSAVREIERGLLISEEILRHLVVVLEPRHRRAGEEAADGAVVEAEGALGPPPVVGDETDGDEVVVSDASAEIATAEPSHSTEDEEQTADLKAAEEVAG